MKRTVGVIGGEGKMGMWLRRFFASVGYPVLSADRNTATTPKELVQRCDVLLLSVPLDAAIHIAREIGPSLSSDQLLTDVCSLKRNIVTAMCEATTAHVVGMHPLFGPATASIRGQNVILCPTGPSDGWHWLQALLESEGAVVTVTDPDTHDRMMAVVQALTHWITITLASLMKRQTDIEQLERFATPVFRLHLGLIGRLLQQDPELYDMLIAANPKASRTIEAFLCEGEDIRKAFVERKEGKALLNRLQTEFGHMFERQADLLEGVIDRHTNAAAAPEPASTSGKRFP